MTKEERQKLTQELQEIESKIRSLKQELRENPEKYAQGLIDKLFNDFKAGARWMHRMKTMVEKDYQVFSCIGRIRHLPAVLSGLKSVIAAQIRRGSNSPIQGFASEIGVKASRLITATYYREGRKLMELHGKEGQPVPRIKFNRIVHDALYYTVPYDMVIPFIHILQYQATYGIARQYEEQFGVKFIIEPEIEVDITGVASESHKWDWSLPDVVDCLSKSLNDLKEINQLDDTPENIMRQILQPWKNTEFRHYLQDKYPLLDVRDLDDQIKDAIKPHFSKKEKAMV